MAGDSLDEKPDLPSPSELADREPAAPSTANPPGTEPRIETLVGLLGDRSPTVWKGVWRELERLGRAPLRELRLAVREGSPRARARARLLLLARSRARALRRLIRFACGEGLDLERGLLLLSRFEEPDLDLRPYLLALDALAAEVLRRIESRPPGIERSLVLCEVLGREVGYRGDTSDYHHPDNVYLHRAIVRRMGMPLTLAAIYLFVARRAGIQAAAVALPGHVVLRLYAAGRSVLVDPFRQGATITEQKCLKYLADHGLPFRPALLDDASEPSLFERHVHHLRRSYERGGLRREVRALELLGRVLRTRRGALARGAARGPR